MSTESAIEYALVSFCNQQGIKCHKLVLASKSGWPDRTLLYKGRAMFIEVKRPGERPTSLQDYMLAMLSNQGFRAIWSDNLTDMKLNVIQWKREVDDAS